jgi:hypothetical protein
MEEIPMKRLAFVLAAAVVGAGCHSSPPPPPPSGTVDIAWSFIRTLNQAGSPTVAYHCGTPGLGIDTVVVSANGSPIALPCADNAGDGAAVALAPGTYTIDVTAFRGGRSGVALFSSSFTNVGVFVNGVTNLSAPLDAVFGPLQINVHFIDPNGFEFSPNTCAAAGVDTYSFHLVDSVGTSVYSSGNISCTNPPGIVLDQASPAGAIDLDSYTIRVIGFSASFDFDSAIKPGCLSPVFNHYGNDVNAFSWNLPVYDVTGLPPAQLCP